MVERARDLFKRIYKIGMILVTLALGAGAALAYVSATPGNGLLLVSGILAILTLMAGLSISKLDEQDEQAETYREIGQDIGRLVSFSTSHSIADPEVHRVDAATLEEAKRMAAEGASIDEICRVVDPAYDGHDPAHQDAFRRVVQTMLQS